jgi:hypothetical protein
VTVQKLLDLEPVHFDLDQQVAFKGREDSVLGAIVQKVVQHERGLKSVLSGRFVISGVGLHRVDYLQLDQACVEHFHQVLVFQSVGNQNQLDLRLAVVLETFDQPP